jgi:hypothetical protein
MEVDPMSEAEKQSSTPADTPKPKPKEMVIGIQQPQHVSVRPSVWARMAIRTSQTVSVTMRLLRWVGDFVTDAVEQVRDVVVDVVERVRLPSGTPPTFDWGKIQDVGKTLLRRGGSFTGPGNFSTWVRRECNKQTPVIETPKTRKQMRRITDPVWDNRPK